MKRINVYEVGYIYPYPDVKEEIKLAVWEKGRPILDKDEFGKLKFSPNVWRRDKCGRAMKYSEYGNTNSNFGWEIDHIYPRALGGKSTLDNLQPLQWENNRKKGDNYPWSCEG